MIKTISINGKEFHCELKRQHRRSITARIRRDGVIEVKAPLLYRESDMLAFLNQHRRWILIISTGCKTLIINRKSMSQERFITILAKNIRFRWLKATQTQLKLKITL